MIANGYTLPGYDINENVRFWRVDGRTVKLPANAVPLHDIPCVPFKVAKTGDVLIAEQRKC